MKKTLREGFQIHLSMASNFQFEGVKDGHVIHLACRFVPATSFASASGNCSSFWWKQHI